MQQATYQADINNSRQLHMQYLATNHANRQIAPLDAILRTHSKNSPTVIVKQDQPRAISLILKVHMMNKNQKIIHQKVGKTICT